MSGSRPERHRCLTLLLVQYMLWNTASVSASVSPPLLSWIVFILFHVLITFTNPPDTPLCRWCHGRPSMQCENDAWKIYLAKNGRKNRPNLTNIWHSCTCLIKTNKSKAGFNAWRQKPINPISQEFSNNKITAASDLCLTIKIGI